MSNLGKFLGIIAFIAIIGFSYLSCDENLNVLSGTVTITGTAQVGQSLSVDISALGGNGLITFQWARGGTIAVGSEDTYMVQTADIGSTITVTVSRSGSIGSITSPPTAVVVAGGSSGDVDGKSTTTLKVSGLPGNGNFSAYVFNSGVNLSTYAAITSAHSSASYQAVGVFSSGNIFYMYAWNGAARVGEWTRSGSFPVLLVNSNGIASNSSNPVYRFATVNFSGGNAEAHLNTFTAVIQNAATVFLTSISVTNVPEKTVYFTGESLDLSGLVVTATYSDSSTKIVTGYTTNPVSGSVLNNAGSTTVQVSYTESGVTMDTSFNVTVNTPTLIGISETNMPIKITYFAGETLDLNGLVITAAYSNGSSRPVTGYTTNPASGAVLNNVGSTTVQVSYTENGVTRNTSFNVTVNTPTLIGISITNMPTKTVYFTGDSIELNGLVITAAYSNGSSNTVTGYTINPVNGAILNNAGITTVQVSYTENGVTRNTSFNVTVNIPTLTGISVTNLPTKTIYITGETLNLSGLVINAFYNNGSSKPVTTYTTTPVNGLVLSNAGTTIVQVSYAENGVTMTANFNVNVTVNAVTLTDISVTNVPTKTTYFVGEALNLNGLVISANYSNGSSNTVTGYTTNPANGIVLSSVGFITVQVSYTEGGVVRTTTFNVTVNAVTLSSISVTNIPTKTTYFVGETLNLNGLIITANYSNGSLSTVTGYTTNPANDAVLNNAGTTIVQVSYTEGYFTMTANIYVTVNTPIMTGISITNMPTKTVYLSGESFNLNGLVISASYNNGSSKPVTGYTTNPANSAVLSNTGTTTVQVSYTEGDVTMTTSFIITVNPSHGSAVITLNVEQIIDGTPIFGNITISRTGTSFPTTYSVMVNAADFDTGSIRWEVAGIGMFSGQTIMSSGTSFTLNATDVRYNSLGGHIVLLTVRKNGMQYQRAIPFTIMP